MKFAILALVGGVSALPAYTDAAVCSDTSGTPKGEVTCYGASNAYSSTNGNQAWCAKLTRG
jgi:hypothetical protein